MMRMYGAVVACLTLVAASGAAAQSVYGCSDLEGRQARASVEGTSGVFYRVNPDLRMFHAFSDESIADLAKLAQALDAHGTTLVYVPMPTKSLAMPDQLPPEAGDLGFDLELATTGYAEIIRRLQEAGVQTADVRKAMRTAPAAGTSGAVAVGLPFFATDPRMTSFGARLAATSIAGTIAATKHYSELPKNRFETRSAGMVTLPSDTRSALQRHCLIALPPVETESFATARTIAAAATATDGAIVGGPAGNAAGRIALVGTDYEGESAANLAGFLAELTGLDVVQYTVPDGGSYGAISSYMTSKAFQTDRPAYLVWANPVFNNLAQFGDQPMAELTAAATDACRVPLPARPGNSTNSASVDLSPLQRGQAYSLLVDADGTDAAEARFTFRAASGQIRSKSVLRQKNQVRTGRFFVPLSGLWPDGAQSVEIVLDVAFGPATTVTACFD